MTPDVSARYSASQAIGRTILAHLGGKAFLASIKSRRLIPNRLIACGKWGPAREECLRIAVVPAIPRKMAGRHYLTVYVQPNGLYGMQLVRSRMYKKPARTIIETRHDIAGADLRRAFAEITGVTKLMETN